MLAEKYKFVPVLSDGDLNADATLSCKSINMKNFHAATFIVGLQTLGGANPTIGVYSGATDAACTTIVPFKYAYGGAATGSASCDVLAAWTDATDVVTIAHASKDNYMLILEVEADKMTDGHNWLTVQFADPSTGSTGNVQVHAILIPRFTSALSATALT